MSNIKIKDVAELAGVSTATVSHVINKTRYVSEKTADRVLHAMQQLNYRPNHAARSLRSTKTYTIGFIMPVHKEDTSKSFFMSIAEGIEETLKKYGYHVIVSNSKEDLELEMEQLQLLNDQITDGIILATTCNDFHKLKDVLMEDHPLVLIDRVPNGYAGDSVSIDSYEGTIQAIKHLKNRGYRRIGYAGADLSISTATKRLDGFRHIQQEVPNLEDMIFIGKPTYKSGYKMAPQIIQHGLDAVFIANNVLATGIVHYLAEHGISIPEEIGIVTFDNFEWTQIVSPSLTVVDQPAYEMGVEAANLILDRIHSIGKKPVQTVLQPTLIKRNST
ncbi:transcriptional regulator, LacI family [Halobacillus karajensis]|uniref:LacI family DNA-binding transcriptional regulator n=1 Tax=Halobacillus karajensis TaxID=195088 RepID=UPI0008A7CD80|nr:LacI family DNA-binding transcriptional regulator [Halobacillus karajensis]SEI13999.1 transcriptional regulator, LacI family [Halobacillus karajensis]